MLVEQPRQLLKHQLRSEPERRLSESLLSLIKLRLFNDWIKCACRPNPVPFGIVPGRCFQLLSCLVVYQRTDVQLVDQNPMHLRTVPGSSPWRDNTVMVEPFGDSLRATTIVGELMKNPPDDSDFVFLSRRQRHSLILDALSLAGRQDLHRLSRFIEQKPLKAEGRLAACPIALLGNLDATAQHLIAQFSAVLGRSKPLKLDVNLMKLIIFFGLSQGGINHLLALTFTFRAICRRQVDILESAPPTDV